MSFTFNENIEISDNVISYLKEIERIGGWFEFLGEYDYLRGGQKYGDAFEESDKLGLIRKCDCGEKNVSIQFCLTDKGKKVLQQYKKENSLIEREKRIYQEIIEEEGCGGEKYLETNQDFTIHAIHLYFLQRFHVEWDNQMYYGSPIIDAKRPYGNKVPYLDILAFKKGKERLTEEELETITDDEIRECMKIHNQMGLVLQIILATGKFETGTYRKFDRYRFNAWKKID